MDKFANKVTSVWPILVFITTLVIWYADVNSRLSTVEAKQEDQNIVIEQVSDIKTDVAVIKANVEFIKQRID